MEFKDAEQVQARRASAVRRTMKSRAKHLDRYKLYQEEYSAKYRQKNGEKLRAYNRAYGKLHYQRNKFRYFLKVQKRRAAMANATVNLKCIEEFVNRVKSRSHCFCYYCQERIPSAKVHFDHIIPIARGGQHSVENLCTACEQCNKSKSSKLVHAWIKTGQLLLEV